MRARSVRVRPHVCCPVYSATSLHSVKSQSVASSGIQESPGPCASPHHPATIHTHVPFRAMCRDASITIVTRFCIRLTAKPVQPHVQPMWQYTSVPTTISPQRAKAIHTVHDSTTRLVVPFADHSTSCTWELYIKQLHKNGKTPK